MVTLDKIRLTGLLPRSPAQAGLLHVSAAPSGGSGCAADEPVDVLANAGSPVIAVSDDHERPTRWDVVATGGRPRQFGDEVAILRSDRADAAGRAFESHGRDRC